MARPRLSESRASSVNFIQANIKLGSQTAFKYMVSHSIPGPRLPILHASSVNFIQENIKLGLQIAFKPKAPTPLEGDVRGFM